MVALREGRGKRGIQYRILDTIDIINEPRRGVQNQTLGLKRRIIGSII